MSGAATLKNGRKRPAPTNNNTINQEFGPNSIKKPYKLFPLPIPKRLATKGDALVCGLGDVGQLGLGADTYERRNPALVSSIKDAVDICAGGMHTLVLNNDGHVYSFGCNDEGALGRDSSKEGSDYVPGLIDLPGKVVMISAGDSHSACLLEDGTVLAWGSFRDSHGNMGLTPEGNKRIPCDILPGIKCCSIASGSDHLVILTCAGHIYTVGCAEQGQLGRVSQRSASGEGRRGNSAMLRPSKVTLRCNLADAIWATNYCTFLRESRTGRIFAFGLNNYKQLAYSKEISVVSNPVLTDCTDVKNIAGGQHHTMVLKNDGTVHVIGRHNYGRLGLGTIDDDLLSLKPIDKLKEKIVDISCGEATSFAITEKGQLYSWGFGSNNQLGTGKDDDVLEPVLIQSKETINKRVLRAASGGQHSVFLVQHTTKDNTKVKENALKENNPSKKNNLTSSKSNNSSK